jgi:ABC-2 type transport system ATP-binding protein
VVVGGVRRRDDDLGHLPVVALPEGRRLTLVFAGVSKWYGDTVALAEVSFELSPGVTGLLGHNGAGKSTALALCAGFADPSTGTVRVLGLDPRREPEVYRRIGIVHDRDGLWPFLTARELVEMMAGLRDVSNPKEAAAEALASVGLEDAAERRVGGFSKGMRQRVKLAQALVHSPEVLLLDEPLNGLDPVQRRHVVELIRRLGSEGRTVLVSSHVLPEVERMAPRVVVLVNGRLVAEGETGAIRDLIRDRPRTVRIAAGASAQALARELVGEGLATGVHIDTGVLVVETGDVDALGRRLMPIARDLGATLERIEPLGDDLESVYTYLTDHARGRGR